MLLAVGILIGLFFAAQIRTVPTRVTNPILPYESLKNAASELENENRALKGQIGVLRKEINTSEKELTNSSRVSNELLTKLEKNKSVAGLTEMEGPGLLITLNDAPGGTSVDKVVSAADLRDIVNVLWLSGAKSIAIGSERLVTTTAIDAVGDTILINSTKSIPPFMIRVIGDPAKLRAGIANPNNLTDLHRRVDNLGLVFTIEEKKSVIVPAFNGVLRSRFAKVEKVSSE